MVLWWCALTNLHTVWKVFVWLDVARECLESRLVVQNAVGDVALFGLA